MRMQSKPKADPKNGPRVHFAFTYSGASSQGSNYGSGSSSDLSESEEFIIDIGNLEFRVYQGDITKANVDIIVNSTNPDFDLRQGMVSKVILQIEGENLKSQVKLLKEDLKSKGMAMTTAARLGCKYILHLNTESRDDTWEEKITKSIIHVDEKHFCSSMAFPTLGQAYGLSIENLAGHFLKAIINVQNKVSTLKQVHVIIFDIQNISKFLEAFKMCCQSYTPPSKGFFKKMSNWFGYGKEQTDIWGKARKKRRPIEDMKSVKLIIYGESLQQINKAIQCIDNCLEGDFKKKIFNESIIKTLTHSQEQEIKKLQENGVDVSVESRIGRIQLHGLMEDVMNASEKVYQMIRRAESIRQEQQAAELMASMVEWCFLDPSAGNELSKYPANISLQLEKALRKQETRTSIKDDKGKNYIIDLTTYEEYPEDDPSDTVKVIRKSKLDGSAFEAPPTWSSMDSKENISVVTLLQNSQEFTDVQNDFIQSTGKSYTVVKIERIQNRMLLQQYDAKLKLLEKQNPPKCTNERMLWHGTANEAVPSINTYGFNRSYCGKNAVVHGNGVYFAKNADYSARDQYSPRDFNRQKRIYRCRVLTGEFCQGRQGMLVPPNKPQGTGGANHILYDSVVDNVNTPGIFVIFNDTQAYPEYLITFQ